MFSDFTYDGAFEKDDSYREWKRSVDKIMREYPDKKLVVIECGAGITVSTNKLFTKKGKSSTRHRISPKSTAVPFILLIKI